MQSPWGGKERDTVSPNAKWILLLRIAFISGRKGRRPGPLSSLSQMRLILKGQHPVIGRHCALSFLQCLRSGLQSRERGIGTGEHKNPQDGRRTGERRQEGKGEEEEQDTKCLLHPEPWLLQPQADCQGWPSGQPWIPTLAEPGDHLRGEEQISRPLTRIMLSKGNPKTSWQRLESPIISLKIEFPLINMLCFSQGCKSINVPKTVGQRHRVIFKNFG